MFLNPFCTHCLNIFPSRITTRSSFSSKGVVSASMSSCFLTNSLSCADRVAGVEVVVADFLGDDGIETGDIGS